MRALLILYLIQGGSGNKQPVIEQIYASDIETCEVAGELISKDLEFKVQEISYRCVNASWTTAGPYITGVE